MYIFRFVRGLSVIAVLIATSLYLGCERNSSLTGHTPVSAKAAVQQEQGLQRTEIVFVSPVPGSSLEFSSNTVLTLSRVEDGKVPPLIFTGENASGSYQAKAFAEGEEIAAWTIPIEPGYKVAVTLRVGKDAEVEKQHPIPPAAPIPDNPSGTSTPSS